MQATTAEIACRALGLEPAGHIWDGSATLHCALEGRPLRAGDRVARFKPGPNFMDDTSMATRSPVISGWIAPFLGRNTMSKIQRAVITPDGIFPVAQRIHRAYFLIHPPTPPFAWVISGATMQHLIWKAPLNLSDKQYRIQLGSYTLHIRQHLLEETVARARESSAKTTLWADADWALRSPSFGKISRGLDADLAKFLTTLTVGEVWAASIILRTTRDDSKDRPTKPEPITLD